MSSSIGAKVLDPGRSVALYKNRDSAPRWCEERPIYTSDLYALACSSSGNGGPEMDRRAGYSIGVNASGLACAEASLPGAVGATDSGTLVQIALEQCASVLPVPQGALLYDGHWLVLHSFDLIRAAH